MKSKIIVIEGLDGSGKATQTKILCEKISALGKKVTKLEYAPTGKGFRQKTRLSKFSNLPELMTAFKECADIKTAQDLNLPEPECERHIIAAEPTETQKNLIQSLSERAEKIHNKQVTPDVDNMLKFTTDGIKIGLDQRLINPLLPDEPNTKINMCVNNVIDIWKQTADERLTQVIFCDYSTPKKQLTIPLIIFPKRSTNTSLKLKLLILSLRTQRLSLQSRF